MSTEASSTAWPLEYGFLDQTLQQLCEGLRTWEGKALESCFLLERKLEPLVMDNSIWGSARVGNAEPQAF